MSPDDARKLITELQDYYNPPFKIVITEYSRHLVNISPGDRRAVYQEIVENSEYMPRIPTFKALIRKFIPDKERPLGKSEIEIVTIADQKVRVDLANHCMGCLIEITEHNNSSDAYLCKGCYIKQIKYVEANRMIKGD